MTAKTIAFHKLPSLDRANAKELIDGLLRVAVQREEQRLGRHLTPQEIEALAFHTFEPISIRVIPSGLH